MTWWAVLTLAAGTYVLKAAGPLALGSRTVPPPLQRALNLVSVTLLAALVAISTFGEGRSLVLDARAAGLGSRARRRLAAGAVRRRRGRRDAHRRRPARAGRRLSASSALAVSQQCGGQAQDEHQLL